MIKPKLCSYFVLACLVFAGVVASADTMVITYRSGKVQKVSMDEPRGEVSGLAYVTDPMPAGPDAKSNGSPRVPADDAPVRPEAVKGAPKDQPAKPKGPGVTFKWAPPIAE